MVAGKIVERAEDDPAAGVVESAAIVRAVVAVDGMDSQVGEQAVGAVGELERGMAVYPPFVAMEAPRSRTQWLAERRVIAVV